MFKVKQSFDRERIESAKIPEMIFAEMARNKRIAITCGSRGISNIAIITKAIADYVKSKGAYPFVVPAMGSHGSATAEGQCALIEGHGVT